MNLIEYWFCVSNCFVNVDNGGIFTTVVIRADHICDNSTASII